MHLLQFGLLVLTLAAGFSAAVAPNILLRHNTGTRNTGTKNTGTKNSNAATSSYQESQIQLSQCPVDGKLLKRATPRQASNIHCIRAPNSNYFCDCQSAALASYNAFAISNNEPVSVGAIEYNSYSQFESVGAYTNNNAPVVFCPGMHVVSKSPLPARVYYGYAQAPYEVSPMLVSSIQITLSQNGLLANVAVKFAKLFVGESATVQSSHIFNDVGINGDNAVFHNNTIESSTRHTLVAQSVDDVQITNNRILNPLRGISIFSCSNAIVQGNFVVNAGVRSFLARNSPNLIVSGNTFTRSIESSLVIEGSRQVSVTNNVINGVVGEDHLNSVPQVEAVGIVLYNCPQAQVIGNQVSNCLDGGILVQYNPTRASIMKRSEHLDDADELVEQPEQAGAKLKQANYYNVPITGYILNNVVEHVGFFGILATGYNQGALLGQMYIKYNKVVDVFFARQLSISYFPQHLPSVVINHRSVFGIGAYGLSAAYIEGNHVNRSSSELFWVAKLNRAVVNSNTGYVSGRDFLRVGAEDFSVSIDPAFAEQVSMTDAHTVRSMEIQRNTAGQIGGNGITFMPGGGNGAEIVSNVFRQVYGSAIFSSAQIVEASTMAPMGLRIVNNRFIMVQECGIELAQSKGNHIVQNYFQYTPCNLCAFHADASDCAENKFSIDATCPSKQTLTCKAIKKLYPSAPNGVYLLDLDNAGSAFTTIDYEPRFHYCIMDSAQLVNTGRISFFNGVEPPEDGWTLAMKTDGRTNILRYEAPYWDAASTAGNDWFFNEAAYSLGSTGPNLDARFLAYELTPFSEVMIGMQDPSDSNDAAIKFTYFSAGGEYSSLRQFFSGSPSVTLCNSASQCKDLQDFLLGEQVPVVSDEPSVDFSSCAAGVNIFHEYIPTLDGTTSTILDTGCSIPSTACAPATQEQPFAARFGFSTGTSVYTVVDASGNQLADYTNVCDAPSQMVGLGMSISRACGSPDVNGIVVELDEVRGSTGGAGCGRSSNVNPTEYLNGEMTDHQYPRIGYILVR